MRHFFRKNKANTEEAETRAAVMDLVFADSEADIREVFARSGSLLTTELADRVLEQLLKEARGDMQLETRLRERLAEIRAAQAQHAGSPLFPRERIIEILQSAESERRFNTFIQKHPEAQQFWDGLIEEHAAASKYIAHIKKFLMLETYREQKLYLKEHPEVLSYTSLAWLEMQLLDPGLDRTRYVFFGLAASLLDDVRHSDIDTAFEQHVDRQSPFDVFTRRRLLASAGDRPTSGKHSASQPDQPRVFLLYQENDESGWTGRIVSELKRNFVLVPTLERSDVVVVIVGEHFGKGQKSPENRKTIKDVTVFPKLRRALAAGKTIIPILVGGGQMPDKLSLPSDVRKLVSRQAVVVDSESALQSISMHVLRGALLEE